MRTLIAAVGMSVAWLGVGADAMKAQTSIQLEPMPDRPLVIRKIPVGDCRAVRGFLGSPVDGTVHSRDYRGTVREYPKTASDGVAYSFNRNDGLHVTLADDQGANFVVLRGGAKARLYGDCESLVDPKDDPPLWTFAGGSPAQVAQLGPRMAARKGSFFGVQEGTLAEVSFYRLAADLPKAASIETRRPGLSIKLEPPASEFETENLDQALQEQFGKDDRRAISLVTDKNARETLELDANQPAHFVTASSAETRGLAAVGLEAQVNGASDSCVMTCVVHDPLNPRLDLAWLPIRLPASGRVQLVFDIPDQVMLPGSRLCITLSFSQKVALAGLDGGSPQFKLYWISSEQALPQALAWRKLLLRTLFSKLSEPRPWGSYRRQSREEFFRSSPYARQCPELFLTLDQCHALAPQDGEVRQYREWVYLHNLPELPQVSAPPVVPAGVPEWAWYSRLAWLETRRIAEWWLDHRLVETGEFGGRVGDDSDMYQQYADLPFFESDGVGGRLREAAARMAELAEAENLRGGLNRNSTDALHAYEEGINHLALMARWFYGDPVYLERCLESARNLEHLTVVTPDGRRHFRDSENMGARDMEKPRPPAVDGHASPLMWHAALQAAEYNRNPHALRLAREWADGWLRFMKPGQWATAIEVLPGRVVAAEKERPLYGGYRTQATVFTRLAALTGDPRYLEPFLHYYRQGKAPLPANNFAGECLNLGFLDSLFAETQRRLIPASAELALYLGGDPAPLTREAIGNPRSSHAGIGSLYDARRWPDMYTVAEQFTDRVFPDILQPASTAYLGGWTRRNKFNPTLAVSWEGFSTNYAALVLVNRRDHLKLAAYSFAAAPMTGRLRVWALEHGRYQLSVGQTAGDSFALKQAERTETLELARADRLSLTLAPGRVTLLEVRQVEKLDDILRRADLAVAARELNVNVANRVLSGVVHNVGAADVAGFTLTVLDGAGKTVASRELGSLPAPLDAVPKRMAFSLPLPDEPAPDWVVVVNPDHRIPEITKANNRAVLPR